MNQIKQNFEQNQQEHIFKYYNDLSEENQKNFIQQCSEIDPNNLGKIFNQLNQEKSVEKNITPFPTVTNLNENLNKKKEWEQIGLKLISEGKVAALLLAGGQGTRLGSNDPKGMFNVGLISKKSLFQLQAERIQRIQNQAFEITGKLGIIPWYIMTSEATHENTKQFFAEKSFFGIDSNNIIFFKQAFMPCITPQGKIILESKEKISTAPDGNGGLYKALDNSGCLKDMKKRGVEWVSQYGVDNILIKVADPIFTGFCAQESADIGVKVVSKAFPEEPVGILSLENEKPAVLEYSEIDEERRLQRNENGTLTYNASHICVNLFSRNILEQIAEKYSDGLGYHIAKKKIPFVNNEGETEIPKEINGWKLESFIFDAFKYSEKLVALEVERNQEFSPLKNANGNDSPITCLKHMKELHINYLEDAGIKVEGEGECEISPQVSYSGENIKLSQKQISLPFHLTDENNK